MSRHRAWDLQVRRHLLGCFRLIVDSSGESFWCDGFRSHKALQRLRRSRSESSPSNLLNVTLISFPQALSGVELRVSERFCRQRDSSTLCRLPPFFSDSFRKVYSFSCIGVSSSGLEPSCEMGRLERDEIGRCKNKMTPNRARPYIRSRM
jgi:hypothetical protein